MGIKEQILDPQVKAVLDGASGPSWEEIPLDQARAAYLEGLPAVVGPALPVHVIEELVLGLRGRELKARLFRPSGDANLPIVVHFHGGGFVLGGEGSHDNLCRRMCSASGAMVLAVDYRLAPEHPFPAAVFDAFDSIEWLHNNANTLGCDMNRLALSGDSAGGNLAAVTAVRMRDVGMTPAKAQVLMYPLTNTAMDTASYIEFADGYRLTRKQMQAFFERYLKEPKDYNNALAAPLLTSDLSNLPPTLVITAGFDPLRDEARAYAERLREEGNEVDAREFSGMVHSFCNMCGVLDKGCEAVEQISIWLSKRLV